MTDYMGNGKINQQNGLFVVSVGILKFVLRRQSKILPTLKIVVIYAGMNGTGEEVKNIENTDTTVTR